mgnify:FL=1|jgi:hypothetical protein
MKKIFLLLSLILVVSKIEATGFITVDGLKFLVDTDKQEATLVANDYSGDIIVPESVSMDGKNYPVTVFTNKCFANCTKLRSIVIPNSVKKLESDCFFGCALLNKIEIPNSVEELGYSCFENCTNLKEVTLSSSLTKLPYTFKGCKALSNISIPSSVTVLLGTFSSCSSLKSIIIPLSVTSLYGTFHNCTNLKEITIPNSVKELSGTFMGCENLENIKIPLSVSKILYRTFYNCKNIRNIDIPESVDTIGNECFYGCHSLENLYLPASLIRIGDQSLYDLPKLTKLVSYSENPPIVFDETDCGRQSCFSPYLVNQCILYVPEECIDKYKQDKCWGEFKYILACNKNPSEISSKCELPTIAYVAGKIRLTSSTPNAKYHYTIADADIKTDAYSENGEITLDAAYKIFAYATADGYKASDKATATLYWINANLETTGINQTKTRGIIASCYDGFISISGLDNNESVSFYTVDGKALGSQKAINGTVSYTIGNNTKIVIARIGENSIKIINN